MSIPVGVTTTCRESLHHQ